LSYVAGLELALDRLRKQSQYVGQEVEQFLQQLDKLCKMPDAGAAGALAEIRDMARQFSALLADLGEPPDDEGHLDRVTNIVLRPTIERVFRRHQRLSGLMNVHLILDLDCEQILWFPRRFDHILENLIANALKYEEANKGETRIQVGVRKATAGYELRVTDNGHGLSRDAQARIFELFDRAGTAHLADPVVGLAVLKLLIEQSGGTLTVESKEGQGASFVAVLPSFAESDYLT
jgi:signal transduction histidine kinase